MPRRTISAGSSSASRTAAATLESCTAPTNSVRAWNALGLRLLQPPVTAVGADSKDDQDRIAPKLERGAVGPGQQFLVNSLEDMPDRRGQLQAGDPQRPKAIRTEGNDNEARQHAKVDEKHPNLDTRIALLQRGNGQYGGGRSRKGRCRDESFVRPPTPPGVKADGKKQRTEDERTKHSGSRTTITVARSIPSSH